MQLKTSHIETAKEIRAFLENNFRENYSYDYLSKAFGLNMFYLKLAFKAVTNDNIHSYLNKLKMDHAKKLLQTTKLNIDLIAADVGLHRSNFCLQFKKYTGQTPAQWRRNLNLDTNSNDPDTPIPKN
jgi:two-component system, response regulator YesN